MDSQTFPNPEMDAPDGYEKTQQALLYAVSLTMGVLNVTKATSWEALRGGGCDGGDGPEHWAEPALADAGVRLTNEQRSILREHADKISLVRRAITKSKDRKGRKKLTVCVCVEPGCDGWSLVSQGTPGPCPIDGSRLVAPKALMPVAGFEPKKTKAKKAPSKRPTPATGQGGLFDTPETPGRPVAGDIDDMPLEDLTEQIDEPADIPVDDLPKYVPERVPLSAAEDDPGYWVDDEPPPW